MKTDHCWIFQICWHIVWSTFTASSFKIWNNSSGIPSSPLALLVLMLPTALLTSHSRMSGSRWVITASGLSGSWRSFLYYSSVYSCHLFLISSASVRTEQALILHLLIQWNIVIIEQATNINEKKCPGWQERHAKIKILKLKGCCWTTNRLQDSWPPEKKKSSWGQRWGLITQSFCVIKFY